MIAQIGKIVVSACASFALLCLAWLAVETVATVRAVGRMAAAIEKTTTEVPAIVDRRAAAIAAALDQRAASLEKTAAARIASVERTVDARLASTEARLDARMGELLAIADRRLGETTSSVQQVASQSSATMASFDSVLRRTDGAIADLHGSIYPWIDCGPGVVGEGKPCLQNELWWMTKKANAAATSLTLASETMSDTLRLYGPSTAKSVDGIAASVDKIGKWYTSKRRLFIEGGLLLFNGFLRPSKN